MARPVAIDVGEYSLKCCQAPDREHVAGLKSVELFPNRLSRDPIPPDQWHLRVLAELQAWTRQTGCEGAQVVCSLRGPGTIGGYLELPRLSDSELSVALQGALAQRAPWPLEQVVYSHMLVPSLTASKLGVLFAIAPKTTVRPLVKLLQDARFSLDRFEMPAVSVARGHAVNHERPPGTFDFLVCPGFSSTLMVVARDGIPYYSRVFGIGGRDFTHAAQLGYQVTWAEAQRRKKAHDLGSRDPIFEPVVQRWLGELKRTVVYVRHTHDFAFSSVHLSGGTAAWRGLPQRVEECLGMTTVREDWDRIRPAKGEESAMFPEYSACVGMVAQVKEVVRR